jgi:small subunit ribosomal protein S29
MSYPSFFCNNEPYMLTPAMASSSCWKCLLRPSASQSHFQVSHVPSRLPALALPFSTSSPLAVKGGPAPRKTKATITANKSKKPATAAKTLKLKKKTVVKTGRPPAPGERKALRKRIILSNSNALEVHDMVDMTAELDAAQIGKVMGLPGPVVDQLRAVEAFKTTQGWGMFRRPSMLIRDKSVEIAKMLQAAVDAKKTSITIIDGEKGAGKSMMLLQAMATAFSKGWIVLNIPEGKIDLNTLKGALLIFGSKQPKS